jgi:serine/threonine-protein kinase
MFVARRNVRAGRGDRQGAARLAAFVAAVTLLSWLLLAHHVPTVRELGLFVGGINWSLFVAGLIWLLYTAVEPYVRRRWPVILVSWARLLQGSFRDALVGRDLLLGVLLGTCTALGARLYQYLLPRWLGLPPSLSGGLTGATPVQASDLRILLGGRYLVGQALSVVPFSILVGLGMTFLLLLYRAVLRWEWLGAAAFILVSTLLSASYAEHPLVSAALAALVWTGMIMVLIRLGLLALVVLWTVLLVLQGSPLTVNLSSWYASTGVLVVMMVVGVGVFGFYATLGGRPLLRRDPLEA